MEDHGETVDRTLVSVGTRVKFEGAGFTRACDVVGPRAGFAQPLGRRSARTAPDGSSPLA